MIVIVWANAGRSEPQHGIAMASVPPAVSEYLTSLFGLSGKTALVTGGARGIGRQIAVAL